MARIAIDARIIYTTTGRYIDGLIRFLAEIDTDNEYIILLDPKDMDRFELPNERFSKVAAPYEQFSFAEQIGFLALLKRINADLVHFTVPHRPVFYFKKQVTTVHDLTLLKTYNSDKNWLVFHAKQFVGYFVFWSIARTSDRIITPTEYVKRDYQNFARISADKITVTYEGAAEALDTQEPYSPLEGKQFLLCVGNQSDYKNIRRLMQAHQELRKKYPELLLVCVGKLSGKNGVTLQRNREWARGEGYEGIVYTDFVSDQQLSWLYHHCATYVFPSLMEGFGLPGLEAMACKAPVASSNATCLPEVYGDAAHYFDPLDITDMTRALSDILDNKELADELIQKGSLRVKEFSWKRMAQQTLDVYNQILSNSKE